MTQPIQEPTTQRSVSGLDWGQSQLARRPGPAPAPFSIPTASLITAYQTLSPAGGGSRSDTVDLSAATFTTNTTLLTKASSGGVWGIQAPGLKLVRAWGWAEMVGPPPGTADGNHSIGVLYVGAGSPFVGPVPDGTDVSSTVIDFTPYVSGSFATAGIYQVRYLSKPTPAAFVLGLEHDYFDWTVANVSWRFGIIVEIVGDPLA